MPSPDSPVLRKGDIHVWQVSLAAQAPAWDQTLLSVSEAGRARGFHCAHARKTYVETRGALRIILSGYLGMAARDVNIRSTPFGKPFLPEQAGILDFNVTHSGDMALIAVARGAVGIDLERVDPDFEWSDAAGVACGASERTHLMTSPFALPRQAFYAHWTAKEAYLKARGTGMAVPPDAVVVRWNDTTSANLTVEAPYTDFQPWTLHCLPVGAPYFAMLATRLTAPRIKSFQFSPTDETSPSANDRGWQPILADDPSNRDRHDDHFLHS